MGEGRSMLIAGWGPQELNEYSGPDVEYPLPPLLTRDLSPNECWVALLALHDSTWNARERLVSEDNISDDHNSFNIPFAVLCSRVPDLTETHLTDLRAILRTVAISLCPPSDIPEVLPVLPMPAPAALQREVDGEEKRPAAPTVAYCLIPPNKVRWDQETEVAPQLYNLLTVLLEQEKWPVPFDAVENAVGDRGKYVSNKVSSLNQALEPIKFPWVFHTKSAHITRE
jgi:hypothetical protein